MARSEVAQGDERGRSSQDGDGVHGVIHSQSAQVTRRELLQRAERHLVAAQGLNVFATHVHVARQIVAVQVDPFEKANFDETTFTLYRAAHTRVETTRF